MKLKIDNVYRKKWETEALRALNLETKEYIFHQSTPLEYSLIDHYGRFTDFTASKIITHYSSMNNFENRPKGMVIEQMLPIAQNLFEGILRLLIVGNTNSGWILHRSIYESLLRLQYALTDKTEKSALELLLVNQLMKRKYIQKIIDYRLENHLSAAVEFEWSLEELRSELLEVNDHINHIQSHFPDIPPSNNLLDLAACARAIDKRSIESDGSSVSIYWHYLVHYSPMSTIVHGNPSTHNFVLDRSSKIDQLYLSGNPRDRISLCSLTLSAAYVYFGAFLEYFYPSDQKYMKKYVIDLDRLIESESREKEKYEKMGVNYIWK